MEKQNIPTNLIIPFIEKYGKDLNRKFRPCIYHEDEGGGVTNQDLEENNEIDFLEKDCITTKEVLKRLFSAQEVVEIRIVGKHASEQLIPLLTNYLQYNYCIIHINNVVIADALHWLTIVNVDDKTYLIQSYLDHYSYEIKEYNYDDLFRQICYMYDNEDILIAKDLMGDVQGNEDLYFKDREKHIKFTFCTYDTRNISLKRAEQLMSQSDLGYTA